jgi:hypothetical protein
MAFVLTRRLARQWKPTSGPSGLRKRISSPTLSARSVAAWEIFLPSYDTTATLAVLPAFGTFAGGLNLRGAAAFEPLSDGADGGRPRPKPGRNIRRGERALLARLRPCYTMGRGQRLMVPFSNFYFFNGLAKI